MKISEKTLKRFCREVLVAAGLTFGDAEIVTENLVEADMRGVGSHGVMRLPIYLRRLESGVVNPRPAIKTVRETRQTAVVDGDNGLGHLVGVKAMALAIEKGASGEPAFVAVRGSNHFGTAAYYAQMAAGEQMIGFSFTIGSINHMTPWGGAEARLGNNPFAIALPAGSERPVVLDMACSVAARGKIMLAVQEDKPIPGGWATDAEGRPTTNASRAMEGFVLPVGGPKGYALTLSIALLSTMLSGAAFGTEITHLYDDLEHPQNTGHLFGVLPVATFVEPEIYAHRMDNAIKEMRDAKKSPGIEQIYLPGEREYLAMAESRLNGITLNDATIADLKAIGERMEIALDP